ncbi:MAG TPA: helix-turn-helix domain-containing protein [Thermoanaerobaculia bacterium]|nr:helix-turn-helix domain-containing protein [Thermoanaerobaculia bacterium]
MPPRESLNCRLLALVEELVSGGVTLEQARREFERQYVIVTLRVHRGSLGRSAQALGVHRNTLRNRISTLRIKPEDYRLDAR